MNQILPFPPRLQLVPNEPAWAQDHPRLHAFERARQVMLERWRELVGSDEQTDAELLDDARCTGAGMSAIAQIMRDIPTQPDQTPPGGA